MYSQNFTISDEVNGPVIATIIGLEILASLLINFFVLIVSLSKPEIIKQPSIIFSTNIVVVNLLTIIYLTPVFVTISYGEWVFGVTVDQKRSSCQFSGAVCFMNVYLLVLSLAIVSVDRFLFIVKPFVHKSYVKAKTALIIVIAAWVVAGLTSIIPFVLGIQESEYTFDEFVGSCGTAWESTFDYEIVLVCFVVCCVGVIAVTTLWAYCYTRKFIQRVNVVDNPTTQPGIAASNSSSSSSMYNYRLLKVFGMFSMFLIATSLCYSPGILVAIAALIFSRKNLPSFCFPAIHVLYFLNYSLISLIQMVFRKELKDAIKKCCLCKKYASLFDMKKNVL